MSKNYNNKEPEKLTEDQLKSIFDGSLFYTETEVEEQKPCIWIQEAGFESTLASFGNISTIVGKPKAGKTFVVSSIISALLTNSTVLNFTGKLPDDRNKVLFVDTEQSKRDCKKVAQRISIMTGTPDEHPKNLIYLRLRGKEPSIIIQIIEYAINNIKSIGAVFIDGVKDLVYSINDEYEATLIASKLLDWSETKSLHIFTVIHQNKIDANTRGHIGTELENKSETVISVDKHQKDKDLIIIKAKLMRNQEFEPFGFRINDGLPELSLIDFSSEIKKSKNAKDYDEEWHIEMLKNIFPLNNNCSGNDFNRLIIDTLKNYGISLSDKPAREFADYYMKKGMVINNGEGRKQKLVLNEEFLR